MTRRRTAKWLEAARKAGAPADWIGRALPRAGLLSRAETAAALAARRVRLNGSVITELTTPVSSLDRVEVDGASVDLHAPTLVLMFHKPPGLIVSGTDSEGAGTVFDALDRVLPDDLKRFGWHAVGRLDRATTGLLLFTNDERVVEHVTAPAKKLEKRYVALTESRIQASHVAALLSGVAIDDGLAHAVSARARGQKELEIVITEGRHHQVRRMLNAVRLAVVALHREAIGHVVLDVPVGQLRRLSTDEISEGLLFRASTESPSSSSRTPPA